MTLGYVKRDARHFCRYLRDPRPFEKRRSPHLSLFTILYHTIAECISSQIGILHSGAVEVSIFVDRRVTLDYVKRDARHFCRYLRDPRPFE